MPAKCLYMYAAFGLKLFAFLKIIRHRYCSASLISSIFRLHLHFARFLSLKLLYRFRPIWASLFHYWRYFFWISSIFRLMAVSSKQRRSPRYRRQPSSRACHSACAISWMGAALKSRRSDTSVLHHMAWRNFRGGTILLYYGGPICGDNSGTFIAAKSWNDISSLLALSALFSYSYHDFVVKHDMYFQTFSTSIQIFHWWACRQPFYFYSFPGRPEGIYSISSSIAGAILSDIVEIFDARSRFHASFAAIHLSLRPRHAW